MDLGSVHVKSAMVLAAQGGIIEVTAADHPRLAGTKIVIQPGALDKDTVVSISVGADIFAEDGTTETAPAGPVVDFGPDGLKFAIDASVTLPVEGKSEADDELEIVVAEADGRLTTIGVEDIQYDGIAQRATFPIESFTRFQSRRRRHRRRARADAGTMAPRPDSGTTSPAPDSGVRPPRADGGTRPPRGMACSSLGMCCASTPMTVQDRCNQAAMAGDDQACQMFLDRLQQRGLCGGSGGGDGGVRPPPGDGGVRPPRGDGGVRPPPGDGGVRPPTGDAGTMTMRCMRASDCMMGEQCCRPMNSRRYACYATPPQGGRCR